MFKQLVHSDNILDVISLHPDQVKKKELVAGAHWNRWATFVVLKGLSHEIFRPVFWPVWMHLALNGNRFSFLNFKEGSLILDSYFKYWCVSCQTFSEILCKYFSEILRISKNDWQLIPRFSENVFQQHKRVFNPNRVWGRQIWLPKLWKKIT